MSVRRFGGLLLLVLGAGGILSVMGVQLGGLIRLVLGGLILFYALKKWQEERYFLGGSMALLGAVFIIGSIHVVVGFLIGAALMYVGWRLFRSKGRGREDSGQHQDLVLKAGPTNSAKQRTGLSDPFDEEWERTMKTSTSQ